MPGDLGGSRLGQWVGVARPGQSPSPCRGAMCAQQMAGPHSRPSSCPALLGATLVPPPAWGVAPSTHTRVLQTLAGPRSTTSQGQGTLCPRTGVRRSGEAGEPAGAPRVPTGGRLSVRRGRHFLRVGLGGPESSHKNGGCVGRWPLTLISCHPAPSSPGSFARHPLPVAPRPGPVVGGGDD